MQDSSAESWLIDVGDQDFEKEVLERSQTVPVVVDFWAEWCGPCRQLGPMIERLVAAKKGAVVLAKVNVDEAQQVAGYFRINSIPTVIAFRDGQAVNGFEGLLAEPQLQQFLDELAPNSGQAAPPVDPVAAIRATEEDSPDTAAAEYRKLLEKDENNEVARVGLGRVLAYQGKTAEALEHLGRLPETGEIGAEVVRLRRLIEMEAAAATAGDEADLRKKMQADPENPRIRYELGNVLATKQQYPEALEVLLSAAELDKAFAKNEVRELMVKIFEIIGVRSEMADEYRDKLRSLLY